MRKYVHHSVSRIANQNEKKNYKNNLPKQLLENILIAC